MEQWIDFQHSLPQRLIREELDATQGKAKNFDLKGHALIRGVAGSGKSLVLRNRVEKLVTEGLQDILVLSYNRFMKGWLESQLAQLGISTPVECKTFHRWAFERLNYRYDCDRHETTRQQIIALAEATSIKYQAILVDEAQDFYDEWFVALLHMLDEQTQSLFFVYDNTQAIYGQSHRCKADWSWKQLGIDVVGRSQIFELNYRNSPEILELAWKFILPSLSQAEIKVAKREQAQGNIGVLIEPKKKRSRSSGILPLLLQVPEKGLAQAISHQVQLALATHPDSSIGVLLHPEFRSLQEEISRALYAAKIPYHAPRSSQERNGNVVHRPYVIVDSWNALKGVEFDAVILAGLDRVIEKEEAERNFQTKASLYTAMTRAKDHLVLLYQDRTPVIEQIEQGLLSPAQLESED